MNVMRAELSYMCVPGIKTEYRNECAPVITADKIITVVCEHLKLTVEQIRGKSRSKEFVYARHLIFYFLRKHTTLTLKSAGELFNRDHTTVIHALENLQDIMDTEPPVKDEVELLESKLFGRG